MDQDSLCMSHQEPCRNQFTGSSSNNLSWNAIVTLVRYSKTAIAIAYPNLRQIPMAVQNFRKNWARMRCRRLRAVLVTSAALLCKHRNKQSYQKRCQALKLPKIAPNLPVRHGKVEPCLQMTEQKNRSKDTAHRLQGHLTALLAEDFSLALRCSVRSCRNWNAAWIKQALIRHEGRKLQCFRQAAARFRTISNRRLELKLVTKVSNQLSDTTPSNKTQFSESILNLMDNYIIQTYVVVTLRHLIV